MNATDSISPRSSTRSFSDLDDHLYELNSAIDIESFWRANLRLLNHALPHHSCSLMLGIVDSQPFAARHHVAADPHPDYRPASSLTVAGNFLARHPRLKVYTFSQIVSEDPEARRRRREQEAERMGSWNEFVHLAFWNRDKPDAVLSVRRGPEHGGFSERDLEFLGRLHPFIDAGLYRLRSLDEERARNEGVERFLAGLPLPVLFLDFHHKLQFASPEGYEACAVWNFGPDQARSLNPRHCFRLPSAIAEACERLRATCDQPEIGRRVLSVEGVRVQHPQNRNLVARAALSQPMRGAWARPGFLVTFTSERNLDGAQLPLPRAALDHLRCLSPSERRVALLIAEGHSNRTIAGQLHKSERTVECQINTIYRKLDISNRVQLARLLS